MATPPTAPEKMTLDRSDGSATIDLYRAALGPVRADYYLKTFTRFDAAGSTGLSWNWAAALLSLNWMLFRKLWTVALAYVGALTASTLLLFGIGRLVFQLSEETQWLLMLACVLVAIVLPGAYGNAWLYAHCNRKMERALAASATLEEACELIAREAVGSKRMVSLAGLNLSLCMLVAAIALSWPHPGALPLHTGPVAQARVEGLVQSAPPMPDASAPAAAPNLTATAPQPTAGLAASPPQPTASAALASQSASLPNNQRMVQEGATAAAALAQTTAAAETTKTTTANEVEQPSPKHQAETVAQATKTEKSAKLTKAERRAKAKADKAEKAEKAAKSAKSAMAASAATKAAEISLAGPAAATSSAPDTGKFLINVGLFADDNNARNAYVKLQDAGLPALSQEIKSSKGKRTRVRVGPFETQAEAERAAERIRALQLDAAVFKQ